MLENERSDKEIKLTAALYAKMKGKRLVNRILKTGHLPKKDISEARWYLPMRELVETRGTDIELSPDEEVVYDVIIRDRRIPGGSIILVADQEKD